MKYLITLIIMSLVFNISSVQADGTAPDLVIVPDGNVAPGVVVTEPNNPVYDATKGLTDQEYMLKRNFVHPGYQQRTYDEACKDNSKLCRGRELDHKFLGIDPSMITALSKAYALVVGAMDSKLKTNVKDENTDVKKEYNDYCRFIAVGTETLGTAMQVLEQKHINDMPSTESTIQQDALYKAALAHKSRAKTAKIQTIGWGSTTACYAFMLTKGVTFKSVGIKLVGAGLLTAFFNNEMSVYDDAYNEVKQIADSLPQKGACNPISETSCYCAQAETKNDLRYCVSPLMKQVHGEQDYVATCIDDKLESDVSCKCELTDTCFDSKLKKITDDLKLASAYNGEIFNPLVAISKGNLKAASIDGNAGLKQAATRAQDLMNQIARKYPVNLNNPLSEKEEKESLALEKAGIPKNLSDLFAQAASPGDTANYISKFNQSDRKKSSTPEKDLEYVSEDKNNLAKKNNPGNDPYDFLKKFGDKSKEAKPRDNYLYFSQKAEKEAQINHNKSDDIWRIISRRYQLAKDNLLDR
ncbi:MAG: hypothetical protein A2381_04740 [Bdellovibrionales bacterium RIFOXYB1_FULL_37_110]|nr:MAG: hypothetical protein A2181_01170 [Bdellovibrionales bacterium RIFOXYA1_FULL_38_20]OFZ50492.1 MAG: hypothetical protein A2417_10720 [Bdellovibrionales bacterium RIFOXYC1_FULL_37_79]OFZ60763.1 MAG: hypothetical protein A2381_04740 [Bdellovibrionales bacterium RIFOXYB1_FULL_37_110]OFZ64477.1 MAG: hypothetical protein A2577_08705 [Bdellovibrionales bacterium RIFOXYD1_FULL_36_51]